MEAFKKQLDIQRPRQPSEHWKRYEREHKGKTQAALRQVDEDLARKLMRADEFHFVPATEEEAMPRLFSTNQEAHNEEQKQNPPREIDPENEMSVSNIAKVLLDTGTEVGVQGLDSKSFVPGVSGFASRVRDQKDWRQHFRQGTDGSRGKYFVYSFSLSERIAKQYILGRRGLSGEIRAAWVQKVSEHFEKLRAKIS